MASGIASNAIEARPPLLEPSFIGPDDSASRLVAEASGKGSGEQSFDGQSGCRDNIKMCFPPGPNFQTFVINLERDKASLKAGRKTAGYASKG